MEMEHFMVQKQMFNYLMYLIDNINVEQFNSIFNYLPDLIFSIELSKHIINKKRNNNNNKMEKIKNKRNNKKRKVNNKRN